ncbi:hypothetical protein DDE05_19145 [Streptomyces cavourensis]|jgi:hypothetical protein|uniref:hypothetical protein n=1 Tax=unclassified Achromobacter TaxID=2626865 RepID=UPI000E022FD4|nr:hypothetical protein DDE05_19145 [Streptomyces cavourensis]
MSSKSSGHFWPAYVDLMTVLLMVFMLLTLLFQMVASIARMQEGLKVTTAASMDKAADAHQGALTLTFANPEAPLQDGQKKEVQAWLHANLEGIATSGLTISAHIPAEGGEVGRRLSSQFSRTLEIKRIAAELQVDEHKLFIVNQLDGALEVAGRIQLYLGRQP